MTIDTIRLVIQDMEQRREKGIKTYGAPLGPHNGRSSLQDAYEEALDLAMYLKNKILEEEEKKAVVQRHGCNKPHPGVDLCFHSTSNIDHGCDGCDLQWPSKCVR